MRIVPAVESEMGRAIRHARALDPLISVAELEKTLERKFNPAFSYHYNEV
jgi:hypothetical protein